MNGGYSMIDSTSMTYNQVGALYAQGKPVIVYTGSTAEPACIAKQGTSYLITTPTTVYTVTSGGVTKANADADAFNYSADTGVKNLLDHSVTSGSGSGLTYTVGDDKSITVSGTATGNFALTIKQVTLPAGEYILSGCPTGGAENTYRMDISGTSYFDTGDGVKFTANGTTSQTIRIRIAEGVELSSAVFKPMVRNARISDTTYQPYTPTNAELYAMILAIESEQSAKSMNGEGVYQTETVKTTRSKKGE